MTTALSPVLVPDQAPDALAPLAPDLHLSRAPELVLAEARRAARALADVLDAKPKKVVLNGEVYLEFEDWQTLGRFYGSRVSRTSRTGNPSRCFNCDRWRKRARARKSSATCSPGSSCSQAINRRPPKSSSRPRTRRRRTRRASDGEKYATLRRELAEIAKGAKEAGAQIEIVYKTTKYGRDVVALRDTSDTEPPL